MCMVTIDEEQIRLETFTFLARKGQGSVNRLAEASGLTTQSIRRVRDGTRVDLETLAKVQEGLTRCGWYDNPEPPIPEKPAVREARGQYREQDSKSVRLLIAERLRNLAKTLESPIVPRDQRVEEFVTLIRLYHASLETYAALIKESE